MREGFENLEMDTYATQFPEKFNENRSVERTKIKFVFLSETLLPTKECSRNKEQSTRATPIAWAHALPLRLV